MCRSEYERQIGRGYGGAVMTLIDLYEGTNWGEACGRV